MFISIMFRLRHNVIKTGIRMICLSYSRISLKDIAAKLCLDSADDAEFIVGKVAFYVFFYIFGYLTGIMIDYGIMVIGMTHTVFFCRPFGMESSMLRLITK